MSELPKGWERTLLNGVVDKIVGGGTPSKSVPSYYEGDIPWMTVKDMNKSYLTDTIDHITQEAIDNSSTNVIPAGTPIIATRMSLGKIVRASFDSAINQDLKALFVNKEVDDYYFEYWYRSQGLKIESLGTGTTVKGVRLEVINALEFPLAPLAEQKRIVEKLDEVLAQVDTIKARLDGIPDLLKRFRQSVLASAVSGKLTEEWRGDHKAESKSLVTQIQEARFDLWKEMELAKYREKNKKAPNSFEKKYKLPDEVPNIPTGLPGSWSVMNWNQISMWVTYGFTKPMPHVESGPLIVTAKNVRNGYVCLENIHRTSQEAFSSLKPKDKPTQGDILIVKDGATTGRASLAPDSSTIGEYCISQSVAVVWLKYSPMLRKYLLWVVQDKTTQSKIQEAMAGMAMPHLSITDFGKMPVPIPPITEQQEIVRLVDQYFAFADTIEAQVKKAQSRVDNLTQSILAKAFRGELVPQDPNDEPAEKLLERIAEARKEAEALAKAAKKAENAKKRAAKKATENN